MCLQDYKMLSALDLSDIPTSKFLQPQSSIAKMLARATAVQNWTISAILDAKKTKDRAKIMAKFIQIAMVGNRKELILFLC